jgi:hypothetical protein
MQHGRSTTTVASVLYKVYRGRYFINNEYCYVFYLRSETEAMGGDPQLQGTRTRISVGCFQIAGNGYNAATDVGWPVSGVRFGAQLEVTVYSSDRRGE